MNLPELPLATDQAHAVDLHRLPAAILANAQRPEEALNHLADLLTKIKSALDAARDNDAFVGRSVQVTFNVTAIPNALATLIRTYLLSLGYTVSAASDTLTISW